MNWAVVMTGGKGVRFWPLSRAKHPKPFLKLAGPKTLLEETVHRLAPLFPPQRILLVIQRELVAPARRLFPKIPRENFLGEPVGRNTAPCCAWAASQIAARDPAAKIIFLPSDQFIRPQSIYLKTLRVALDLADDRPVLLGFRPTSPHPGYGYLEVDRRGRRVGKISIFKVRRFHEKPSLATARKFLRRGNFFWNGGTFVWRLDAFERAIRKYLPGVYRVWGKLADVGAARSIYETLPSISLDYGVMEKLKEAQCLVAPFEWRDLGSWEGAAELWSTDSGKNRARGDVLLLASRDNIIHADRRLVALLGVRNLVVVDSSDALLICPRDRAEEVRQVVRELERRKMRRYL